MHGLRELLRMRGFLSRINSQDGWVLMDAVWSSVVVVLAFIGTTMAFEGSNRSVARDMTKGQAMYVAQNEMEKMRALAQSDIAGLTCKYTVSTPNCQDGSTSSITYRGVKYNIAKSAYYVASIDGNDVDACGTAYSNNNSAARYIYMKVTVTYAGQKTYSGGNYQKTPTSLVSYYAPEGGASQTNTGTLRVYVLDRDDAVITSPTSIDLYQGSTSNPVFATAPINPSTGCALFTGLPRATYFIRAAVSANLQDLYLSNSGSPSAVTQKVNFPYRGALTRVMRVDDPNTVTTTFKTYTGTGKTNPVTVSGTGSSAFVGPWVAMNDEIFSDPTLDYATGPGRTYMPHAVNTTMANKLFPLADGYSAYAGPCNLNDPDDQAVWGSEWQPVPLASELGTSVWAPGSTYTTNLWLSQMRARVYAAGAAKPSLPLAGNTTYRWGQALSFGKVAVRLEGDQKGSAVYVSCGSRSSLFNTWQRLPGTVDTTTGYLNDQAEALPTGTYDVCIYARVTYYSQATNIYGTSWSGSPVTNTVDIYRIMDSTDPSLGALKFQSSLNPIFNLSSVTAAEGDSSTCSGAVWT